MNDLERVLRELARLAERLTRLPDGPHEDRVSLETQREDLEQRAAHLRGRGNTDDQAPDKQAS